ncbi:RNA polymerase sigma factor [Botrimarina colliarenosi]|uniref:RNA polymerase sigma factor n=1 Tax=Botrimarina colliarenosi TaxID=2528001 RepID=A0A5C6AM07_9BACT|nr:sigma-70 family RNA polymerase sigma factor [Botrimarina colliarenosi]TWU00451.1 RNA polymerase sigma factor [Botrimarina colliarenosi]
MEENSVTRLLREAKLGDADAAADLCRRYYQQLVPLARKRLLSTQRRVADEEDVVNQTLLQLLQGIADERFHKLDNRGDLWQILLVLLARNATSQHRRWSRLKRGGGKVRGESAFARKDEDSGGIGEFLSQPATQETVTEFIDAFQKAFQPFEGSETAEVILLRLQGLTAKEIAARLGKSERTIQRDLLKVRCRWENFFV